jgi:DHA2 family multidrug resistance protein
MLATIIYSLDTTVANVALPHIQGSLSAAQDQITWVLTSYIVASAIMTPLSGWLSSKIGRKKLFLISVAGFTIASMLCGIASNLPEIVAFRMLQGAAGAMMLPISQSILLDINPPEKHGQAMAIWSAGALLGPIFGPILGGWLTENLSWRFAFFINLPVGLLALIGVWLFIPATFGEKPKRFDFLGFFALALAVGALQVMLDRGPGEGWFGSPEIWIELIITLIALWVFVTHTATTRHPFFDPSIIRDRNFVTCNALNLVIGAMLYSSLALWPSLMQNLLGYPVMFSGLVTVSRGAGAMLMMGFIGWMMNRFDVRLILFVGFLTASAAAWQASQFDLSMTARPFVISGFIQGVATGVLFVPLTALAFATLKPEIRPEASALFGLLRNIATSVGISVMQGMVVRNTQVMHASLAAHVDPSDPVVSADLLPRFDLSTIPGLEALNAEITRQSAMVAYVNDFRVMFWAMVLCIPAVLIMRPSKRQGERINVVVE